MERTTNQIFRAFFTRPTIEEYMLTFMNKSTYEENLSQSLQTNSKQFQIAVTFLTDFSFIFHVLNENLKLYFLRLIFDVDGFI